MAIVHLALERGKRLPAPAFRAPAGPIPAGLTPVKDEYVTIFQQEFSVTKRFLISYDLDKPGQDYPRIWTELARLGARRVLYSQWVLRSPRAAMELVNYFKEFIDANDRLLVVSLEDDWASWQGMININDLAA